MFISFPGVAASFASVAYRIAISNFLSASLGAVRFLFFEAVWWCSCQKICWSLFALVYACVIETQAHAVNCRTGSGHLIFSLT